MDLPAPPYASLTFYAVTHKGREFLKCGIVTRGATAPTQADIEAAVAEAKFIYGADFPNIKRIDYAVTDTAWSPPA